MTRSRLLPRLSIDWRSAFGELAIVVLGILIAFALNAWWQGRVEAATVRESLLAIQRDFESNRTEFDLVTSHSVGYIQDVERLATLSADEIDQLEPDEVSRLVGRMATGGLTFDPTLGAVEAFLAAERLDRIGNDRLRREIAAWPGIMDELSEDQAILIDMYMAQQERSVELGIYLLELRSRSSEAPLEIEREILRRVVTDPEMLNRLAAHSAAIEGLQLELVERVQGSGKGVERVQG